MAEQPLAKYPLEPDTTLPIPNLPSDKEDKPISLPEDANSIKYRKNKSNTERAITTL